QVEEVQRRMPTRDLVGDGVKQVRLAEPGAAVQKQRVVGSRGQLGDRLARGLGELVGAAHDERCEGVPRIDLAIARRDWRSLDFGWWSWPSSRLDPVDFDRDARIAAQDVDRRAPKCRKIVAGHPFANELAGSCHSEM